MVATIFTVFLKPYDKDYPAGERIQKILAGNQEVRCSHISLDFDANGNDFLTIQIPSRYVNIIVREEED